MNRHLFLAAAIGHRLAKQSGRPTGVIHMTSDEVPLSSWIPFKDLKNAPSLKADYENLAQIQPGNAIYDANVRRFIGAWKQYWSEFIPQMIATRGVPNGEKWGTYPQLDAIQGTRTENHRPGNHRGHPPRHRNLRLGGLLAGAGNHREMTQADTITELITKDSNALMKNNRQKSIGMVLWAALSVLSATANVIPLKLPPVK